MLLPLALLACATVARAGDTCRETHVVLHNGVEMPRVGFGLAGMHGEDTMQSVEAHLRAGFRMLDGAEATEWYGAACIEQRPAVPVRVLGTHIRPNLGNVKGMTTKQPAFSYLAQRILFVRICLLLLRFTPKILVRRKRALR